MMYCCQDPPLLIFRKRDGGQFADRHRTAMPLFAGSSQPRRPARTDAQTCTEYGNENPMARRRDSRIADHRKLLAGNGAGTEPPMSLRMLTSARRSLSLWRLIGYENDELYPETFAKLARPSRRRCLVPEDWRDGARLSHPAYAPEFRRQMVELLRSGRNAGGAVTRVRANGASDLELGAPSRTGCWPP
jgi:hypothetical protein